MAYINLLDTVGNIFNKEECLEFLKQLSGNMSVVASSINYHYGQTKSSCRYFRSDLHPTKSTDKKAHYMWVDSGLKHRDTDEALYFSFYKAGLGWEGAIIGTENFILNNSTRKIGDAIIPSIHQANVRSQGKSYIKPVDVDCPTLGSAFSSDVTSKLLAMASEHVEETVKEVIPNKSSRIEVKEVNKNVIINKVETTKVLPVNSIIVKEVIEQKEPVVIKSEVVVDLNKVNKTVPEFSKDTCFKYGEADEDVNSVYESVKNFNSPFLVQAIFSRLLVKSAWTSPTEQISSYLGTIVARVTHLIYTNKHTDCFEFNKDRSKVVINTALVDKFGNDIFLLFIYQRGMLSSPCILDSRIALLSNNFDTSSTLKQIAPVPFTDKLDDLIFSASIDDIDLSNWSRLDHIITERRSRFPESVRNLPADVLASKLVESVSTAIKLSKRDFRHVLPVYSVETDLIQYLIPYHINRSFDSTPELVIILGKFGTFYNVMTILPLESAYVNQKVITPYSDSWLTKAVLADKKA